jgi:integrase
MAGRRRRFGRLRKLPSGTWQARYPDASGRLVTAPQTFPNKTDADRFLAAVETDLRRGDWSDPRAGSETLTSYANRWLLTRRVRGRPLAPRTMALYRWQLDKHVLPALGPRQLRQLDPSTVRLWYGELSGPGGPGPVTAAKCYRLLRAITNTAVRDGQLKASPCVIVGAGDEHSPERPALALSQVLAIAEAVPARWKAFVLLAAFGGLRIGELAALTRDSIDLEHGTVSVTASASYLPGGTRNVGPPKSKAGRRTVALPELVVVALIDHLESFADPEPAGLVFVGVRGAPVRETTFGTSVWRPTMRRLGLTGLHFHDLRGFAATLAAITGATTAELMHRLGHATPDVALRYQRATAARDAAIAHTIDELVKASAP